MCFAPSYFQFTAFWVGGGIPHWKRFSIRIKKKYFDQFWPKKGPEQYFSTSISNNDMCAFVGNHLISGIRVNKCSRLFLTYFGQIRPQNAG